MEHHGMQKNKTFDILAGEWQDVERPVAFAPPKILTQREDPQGPGHFCTAHAGRRVDHVSERSCRFSFRRGTSSSSARVIRVSTGIFRRFERFESIGFSVSYRQD